MYDTAHPGKSTREEDISMDQDITETEKEMMVQSFHGLRLVNFKHSQKLWSWWVTKEVSVPWFLAFI